MDKVKVPQTVDEVVSSLTGIEGLLRAKEWERSVVIRAYTQPGTAPGKLTFEEFAKLGIAGLSNKDTVAHYWNAWSLAIEAGASEPKPGQTVVLPTLDWPNNPTVAWGVKDPRRRDALKEQAAIDGVGPSKVLDVASNPKAVAAAMKADPEFVRKIVDDSGSRLAVLRAMGQRNADRAPASPRQPEPPEPFARLLALLNVDAVDVETATMEKLFMKEFSGDFVWRPGERERLISQLELSATRIANAIAIISFEIPATVTGS